VVAIIRHIDQKMPTKVPVITGSEDILVLCREERNVYQTNRIIKVYACWYLLKALTTSGKIQGWRGQLSKLLPWLQLSERTFYRHLDTMEEIGLVSFPPGSNDITFISYERAADILGIFYHGTHSIDYDPEKQKGKQLFQYLLRGEELRRQQHKQLEAIRYYLDENPSEKADLVQLLQNAGYQRSKLEKNIRYLQECLLELQLQVFKKGSAIFDLIFWRRADINRCVTTIQRDHKYKHKTSVSYMKKVMAKFGLITVKKRHSESEVRSRLEYADGNGKRQAYKWVRKKNRTVLFLTDQINFCYESTPGTMEPKKGHEKAARAA
jgi:hypothetical protein